MCEAGFRGVGWHHAQALLRDLVAFGELVVVGRNIRQNLVYKLRTGKRVAGASATIWEMRRQRREQGTVTYRTELVSPRWQKGRQGSGSVATRQAQGTP
jgi:hypothetical protein